MLLSEIKHELEIVFMKHCAPTICLFIRMISLGKLLTILSELTKSEATSCNGFRDLFLFLIFLCASLQRAITRKNPKGNYSKKIIFFSLNFHKVIYSLSSISCPRLKLLTVIVVEKPNFLCANFQRTITHKKLITFFNFSPGNLLIIFYQLTKFEAPTCYTLF